MKRIYEEKILKNPKETLFENVEAALKKINNSQTALYGSLEAVDALEGRKCNFQVRKYKIFGTVEVLSEPFFQGRLRFKLSNANGHGSAKKFSIP